MSRLDGNERWNSKMLLTEHQEQYDRRHEPPGTRPTAEEFTLVRDSVVLRNMQIMVERSLEEIGLSSHLLKKLYTAVTQLVLNRISTDLYALQREMKKRSIKLTNDEQADNVLYFRFVCRGYEDRFGIMREALRAEMSLRLGAMVTELLSELKQKAN
ncbi:MAG: hypothetical protein K0Q90_2614 [Paenibacillaceae bacterium]|jgi:hypothetical protein|nr:hypothetical protein [Paenibacillaceae bacterium]